MHGAAIKLMIRKKGTATLNKFERSNMKYLMTASTVRGNPKKGENLIFKLQTTFIQSLQNFIQFLAELHHAILFHKTLDQIYRFKSKTPYNKKSIAF